MPDTVTYGDLSARHLPFSALASKLMYRLDKKKYAIPSRVCKGKPTTIGIKRQLSPGSSTLSFYKRAAFTLLAKPQVFQLQQHGHGEGIVKLRYIDIFSGQPGHLKGCLP